MRLFISAIALLLSINLLGQTRSVSGTIKSQGEALPGATVRILGQGGGTVTDPNGRFTLEGIAEGNYKVEVRSIGLKPQVIAVNLKDRSVSNLAIEMEESVLNMDEVVVTGTMQPTFVSQSPIKVEVITSQHINTYLPAAASGLVESVSLINGVQEVVACGVCFTNSISINGLPGPYTAVLMDGTPIYGNLASVYGLNGIPSMIIDRFEVIKGPSSTLYGSEAVAGVINIITKDPKSQPTFSIDVMGTSHLESFGNLAFAPKFKKVNGFVGLNYAYINDFDDVNEDGFSDMASLDRLSLFTKWSVDRKSNKPFFVSAKFYYEDRRNGVEEFLADRNYRSLRGSDQIYGESIYTHRAEVFGKYGLNGFENSWLNYSFSVHRQDSYYGSDYYKAEQNIGFINWAINKKFGNHDLLGGATLRYQDYDDNTVATEVDKGGETTNKPNEQWIMGAFIQDEWSIGKKWTVLTGLRSDHYEEHGLILAPRVNVKYKPGQWTTLRSNFGTGFRVVNLFTEDHAFLSGQRQVVITESLKPERSYNWSLNANHVYTIGASQGSIDIDGYFTYFTNKIIPNYDQPTQIIYENTDGHAITKGIGATINQEFTFPLAFNLSVNLQEATETEKSDSGENETLDIEFSPEWSGIFTANYRLKKAKTTLSYTWKMTGPMSLPEVFDLDSSGEMMTTARPTKSSSFAIHNFQLNKVLNGGFGVYLGVQNIFNYIQEYSPLVGYNDPNAAPGFSSNFDTSYAYGPVHGREFYLGINWKID
ncbi:TonB-dependent receptor [Marinoscillum sp. MHG1-6]|uniref:TonB-dependent receptor n=1 Tax=Marinoscillum sp. MHG1-6 TaxID=2959627 RepID=UPI00215720EF|nr:TonB-dependent receptor [Marinoscillum sp. MHG1-6]